MRDQPTPAGDPYATLGLERGATMADVKRAYRRLAKAVHPDSAGEAALPRFLAIHEAYEAIRTGRPMARARDADPATGPRDPWRADPERARAARERSARRGTAGGSGTGRPAGGAGGGSTSARSGARAPGAGSPGSAAGSPGAGARSGGPRTTGSPGSSGRTRTSGGTRSGGRRHVRKATMGSTSYDDARDPNDATWSGASWYGPSTGEYWIVNPREYADPRKHGPEYQSRARRPLGASEDEDAIGAPPDGSSADADTETLGRPTATAGAAATGSPAAGAAAAAAAAAASADGATGWTFDRSGPRARATSTGRAASTAGPTSTAGAEPRARSQPLARPDRPRRGEWTRPAPDIATAEAPPIGAPGWEPAWRGDLRTLRRRRGVGLPGGTPRDWIGGAADDPIRRLGIALVAWPPIGLAAAALIGDVTGCSVYSAECGGTEPLLPWLAQAVILGLLLLLPPIARILAGGSIGVLFALVPVTAFLVAVGGSGAPQAGFALTFFLAVAWLAGVGWGAWQQVRRGPTRAAP